MSSVSNRPGLNVGFPGLLKLEVSQVVFEITQGVHKEHTGKSLISTSSETQHCHFLNQRVFVYAIQHFSENFLQAYEA